MRHPQRSHGFSLVEVLVGIFLIGVAVLGLAQIFLVAVTNNLRADRIANATFLAQQQIDWLRGFTLDELSALDGAPPTDEVLDLNSDAVNDYRRITVLDSQEDTFQVRVYVYSAENINSVSPSALTADPERYRPRALISTLITR